MPTHHPHNAPRPGDPSGSVGLRHNAIQWLVAALGVIFVVVAIGAAATAHWVHVVVYAGLGVAAWWSSRTVGGSWTYLVWGGLVLLTLAFVAGLAGP